MDFNDKLFEVLRNFMEYGNYQGKIDKAVAVIKKSYPQKSKEELVILFEQCIQAYKDALQLVNNNIKHYSSGDTAVLKAEINFKKKYSSLPEPLSNWIIGWVYHWYHER